VKYGTRLHKHFGGIALIMVALTYKATRRHNLQRRNVKRSVTFLFVTTISVREFICQLHATRLFSTVKAATMQG